MKYLSLTLLTIFLSIASYATPSPITGQFSVCIGSSTTTLSDATPTGTWSSSNTSIATIGSTSGTITGLSVGTSIITYTAGGSYVTQTIYVVSLPNIYPLIMPGGASYCSGGAGVDILLNGSQTGVSYTLYHNGLLVSAAYLGNGSTVDFGNYKIAGVYTAVGVNSTCAVNMPDSDTVSINPLPNVYTVTLPSGSSYCAGGTGVDITLSNSDPGINYQLYDYGALIGGLLPGIGHTLDFGIYPAGLYSAIAIDPVTTCVSNMSGIATVTVNPLPNVYTVSTGGSYCAGGPGYDIQLSSSDVGTSYQLLVGGTALGLPKTGIGTLLDFGYNVAGIYTIEARNNTTLCSSNMSGSATISVSPLPSVYTLSTGGSYCSGGAGIDLTLNNSGPGISYQLYNGSFPVPGGMLTGTGSMLDFGPQGAGTYHVVAQDLTTGCTSAMSGTASIIANPLPNAYAMTGGGSYCAGGPGLDISLSSSDLGIDYAVKNGGVTISTYSGTGSHLNFGYKTAGIYSVMATNTTTGCSSTTTSVTITADPLPTDYTVTGGGSYCAGGSGLHILLSGSDAGISYKLYNAGTLVATQPGAGSALDFGPQATAGTYKVVASNIITGCMDTMTSSATISVNSLPTVYTVTGGGSYCSGGAGVHVGLSHSAYGINYDLYLGGSPTGITLPGTSSSLDYGVKSAAGVYTVLASNAATGCTDTMAGSATVTILPLLSSAITGPGSVCTGATITLTDTSSGGTWSSDNTAVATVGASSGIVTGISAGSTDITYNLGGCYISVPSTTITIYTTPVITGGSNVCTSLISTLTGSITGVWTSSNTTIANVATIGGSTGDVTGIATGVCVITLTGSGGCYATNTMTVSPLPVVTATSSSSCGDVYTLTAGGGVAYSWLPSGGLSCSTCAITTINPSATTTYTVIGTDALGCPNSDTVTVNGNRIKGFITFGGPTPDTLAMRVWLIQYDPTDSSIKALDSTITCTVDSIGYYEFDNKPAGNYLAKAKLLYGNVPGSSGYVPTYSLSTPNWNTAASIAHTGGSDTLHVNMIYGIVPPGPGFISGYVYAGAGKGTSGNIPVQGMLMYLEDNTGNVLTYTYTDATGNYSFSGLGFDDFIIYPEQYDYNTTPSNIIALNSSNPIANGVDFRQYTDSRTIVPVSVPSIVKSLSNTDGLNVFPNPTSGNLNIQWQNQVQGTANVVITDVIGHEVFSSILNMSTISGQGQINLQYLKNGIYLITIRSDNIYYSGKLEVQQ